MDISVKRVGLLTASLWVLTACAVTEVNQAPAKPAYETYIHQGQQFTLPVYTDMNGQTVDFTQSKNRKLMVYFATWCSDSQRLVKQLMASDYVNNSMVDIIGIGREENNEALLKFAKEYSTSFPLVADVDRAYYKKIANAGIPRVIVLDENNKVIKTIIGEDPNTIGLISWE